MFPADERRDALHSDVAEDAGLVGGAVVTAPDGATRAVGAGDRVKDGG